MSSKKFGSTILSVKKARDEKYVYWRREHESNLTCIGTRLQVLTTIDLFIRTFIKTEELYLSTEGMFINFLKAFKADNLAEFIIHVTRNYDDFISLMDAMGHWLWSQQ